MEIQNDYQMMLLSLERIEPFVEWKILNSVFSIKWIQVSDKTLIYFVL